MQIVTDNATEISETTKNLFVCVGCQFPSSQGSRWECGAAAEEAAGSVPGAGAWRQPPGDPHPECHEHQFQQNNSWKCFFRL